MRPFNFIIQEKMHAAPVIYRRRPESRLVPQAGPCVQGWPGMFASSVWRGSQGPGQALLPGPL